MSNLELLMQLPMAVADPGFLDRGFKFTKGIRLCFVVTYWERADLLALVCGVYCEFVTFPLVSWIRCGT